jgi:short-subunit dehydrogenase
MSCCGHVRVFGGKRIVIFGGTGGLGKAICEELSQMRPAPTTIIPLSRSTTPAVDAQEHQSIQAFLDATVLPIDIVINAIGISVRKPFGDSTPDEISSCIGVNLKGAINITHCCLPALSPDGVIVHLGGYGDGGLAFPYHSIDVATRAGIYSFCESINRELKVTNSRQRLLYFCPLAADTDAERPWHQLWQRMGMSPVSASAVAREVLSSIQARHKTKLMGTGTTTLAVLNRCCPRLVDFLLLNGWSRQIRDYFESQA